MNKFLLFILSLFVSLSLLSQEICDNGIDDDGDGLIDMNDSLECFCTGSSSTTVPSLIPNPSFEDYSCCPSSWTQLSCADTWIQASGATSDYLNTCNYIGNAPQPFPDGNGAAAMIFTDNWTEYIGACLLSPMLAGDDYQITFYLGFKYLTGQVGSCASSTVLPPIDFTIFGTPNCSELPFSGSSNCPVGLGNWMELGHVTVDPMAIQNTWATYTISFTPTVDINAVVIGAPCTFPAGGLYDNPQNGCLPFFFIDGLIMNATMMFGLPITETGHTCTNNLVLSVTPDTIGTCQWFYNGVAIPGETNTSINISANGYPMGDYMCVFTYGTACASAEITIDYTYPVATISNNVTLCGGGSTTITAGGGTSYLWDNGLGAGASHTVSPTTTTTYNVTVYDANGCEDYESVTVSVNPSPIANAGTGGTFCSDNFTFTAVASVGNGTWTYTGPGNATFAPNANTANATVTVDAWGTYTFTWTEDNNGCIDSDDVIVTFNYTPTSTFTALPNSVCTGEDVIVTYTGTGSPTATYTWNFGGGTAVPGTGQGPHTVNWSSVGNPNITLSVSENGCTSIVTSVPVTVYSPYTSDFFITQPPCFGDNAILTYTGNAPASATFNWVFGGGSANPGSGMGPQNVSYASAGTFNVSLMVEDNGCLSPVTNQQVFMPTDIVASIIGTNILCNGETNGEADLTVSGGTLPYTFLWSNQETTEDVTGLSANYYNVVVSDAKSCTEVAYIDIVEPSAVHISSPNNDNICLGQTSILSVIATGGTAPYTYVWNGDTTNMASYAVTPTSTTVYNVFAIDANGCISETEYATINVSPIVSLELFTNDEYVCPGEPALISANILSGVPPYYLYTVDGVITTPFVIYPDTTVYYEVFVMDQCGTTASDDITIYTYPLPPVSFQADEYQGCAPFTVNFHENNTSVNVGYLWNFGDNDFDNLSYDKEPTHIYDDAGVYTVSLTVTSAEGCQSTQVIEDMITVYPTPVSKFTADPEVVSIIKPVILFENYSTMADSYIWLFGDGDTSGTINPSHVYPIYPTGVYNVGLIAITLNGCKDTSYQEIIVQDEYTFYAPTAFSPDFDGINDYFNVKGNGIDKRNFKMYIYDRWGEVVFETEDLYEGWDGRIKDGDIGKNGVYTWLVDYKDLNGNAHQEAGAVTIVR